MKKVLECENPNQNLKLVYNYLKLANCFKNLWLLLEFSYDKMYLNPTWKILYGFLYTQLFISGLLLCLPPMTKYLVGTWNMSSFVRILFYTLFAVSFVLWADAMNLLKEGLPEVEGDCGEISQ